MRKFAFTALLIFLFISTDSVFCQEDQDQNPWVYETAYQVPWSKVDSFTKLLELTDDYGFYEKAKELGKIVDFRAYIHHTGDIWNVKIQWVHSTWKELNAGWKAKDVWEAIGVDEEEVKRINSGFSWIFDDEVIHFDNIYRLIIGAK